MKETQLKIKEAAETKLGLEAERADLAHQVNHARILFGLIFLY